MHKVNASNTDRNNDAAARQGLASKLEEIRLLEKKLIGLKHEFIEASAIPLDDEDEENEATFLLLVNSGRLFAVPISHVDEVVQTVELTPLPEKVDGVAGLVDYHGEMMAVIDLGVLFGIPERPMSADLIMLICTSEILRFAVIVDEVSDVVSVSSENIHVADEVLPGALRALGVLKNNDDRALILDVLSIILSIQLDRLRTSVAPPPLVDGASGEDSNQ